MHKANTYILSSILINSLCNRAKVSNPFLLYSLHYTLETKSTRNISSNSLTKQLRLYSFFRRIDDKSCFCLLNRRNKTLQEKSIY